MSISPSPTRLSTLSSSQSSSSSRSSSRTASPGNTHLLKSTLVAPDNIAELRQQFFSILQSPETRVPLHLWQRVYPFLENVYVIEKDRGKRLYYSCRWSKAPQRTEIPLNKRKRHNASANNAQRCPVTSLIGWVEDGQIQFKAKGPPEDWPQHNHTLDWSDQLKMNKAIRDYVATEVTKGYKPGEILANIQGKRHARNEDWLDACGGRYLDVKLICNAGRAFLQTNRDTKRDDNKEDPAEQLSQANSFICQQGEWKSQEIRCIRECDSGVSQAIVFAKTTRIKTLCRRGYLTLLDSTHNTNILGWKLFSLMVRDEQGMFIPCAHFLASNEDGDIIGGAVKVLQEWTGGVHGWKLRYMLTDDSAAEQRGVRLAFTNQDEPVGHLLCTKHASDTLDRRLSGNNRKKARDHMFAAMFVRKTRMGCRESVEAAINSLSSQDDKQYLRKEWLSNIDSWALCARSHSCILLQVTTTNNLESWHKSLKNGVKNSMRHWSLKGAIERVIQISRIWENRAAVAETKFHGKHLVIAAGFPAMRQLPFPIQRLIGTEIVQAEELDRQSYPIHPQGDELSCKCKFYRKYLLPCRHIFYWENRMGGVLREEHWKKWIYMFEQGVSGYEIYESISTEWIEEDIYQGIGAPARRKLQVREILAATMQKYYEIEEAIAEEGWPEEQAQEAIQEWLQLLGSSTGPLRAMALQELKNKLSPESQQAISQSQRRGRPLKRPHGELEKDDDEAVEWDEINDVNWDMELIEVGDGLGLDNDDG